MEEIKARQKKKALRKEKQCEVLKDYRSKGVKEEIEKPVLKTKKTKRSAYKISR